MYVRCVRRDHISLLRLSERATFQHNPEHGLLVRLLINLAKRVGVRPPPSGGNVSVGEMLPFRGPLPPVGVPQAAVELFQSCELLRLLEPLGGEMSADGLGQVARRGKEVGVADAWTLLENAINGSP